MLFLMLRIHKQDIYEILYVTLYVQQWAGVETILLIWYGLHQGICFYFLHLQYLE
jgi:hypothetical protein